MRSSPQRNWGVADVSPLALLGLPVVTTAALVWTSPNSSEMSAVVYAFLLLLLPWGSFLTWRQGKREGLPVFAMVAGAYWIYFGVALLWGRRELFLAGAVTTYVPSETVVTETMALTFVGMVAMWLGMRVPIAIWVPEHLPDVVDAPRNWTYIRAVLLAGVALRLYAGSAWLLGAGGRQAMVAMATIVPNVAFVLLLCRHVGGRATRADKIVLAIAVGVLLIGGLSSGWLGSVAIVALLYGSVVVLKRREVPWLAMGGTILVVLFLQVGKNEFRNVYWVGPTDATMSERARFWLEQSASKWGSAFQSGDSENAQSLAAESLSRVSLLAQVAHVVELTPSQVPFQEGATYQYLAVTFIPRFLWPDKPSVSDANRLYQVEYSLTIERGLNDVSIAVGSLGEGYINFGWPGTIGVMFVIGLVLGIYERTFGLTQSSSLFLAIGIALIPGFVAIESQLGQYFGGVIQQAALAALVFLPITKRRGLATGAPGLPSNGTLPHGSARLRNAS